PRVDRDGASRERRRVPATGAAGQPRGRTSLPVMRPLCLVDPEDPEGWAIADSYLLGPSLWVAPMLDEGAAERRTYLPRGEWLDWGSGERIEGGGGVDAEAPLHRIPLWGRGGSLVTTHPAGEVKRGLGGAELPR